MLCSGGVAFGDVATFLNPQTGTISGIIVGRIIEDADPIENSIWMMIRPNNYATLNPDGAIGDRTDGSPSIVRLDDGTAIAFWDLGITETDRDIVMSRWSAAGWAPLTWVSDAPELEFGPRAVIDAEGAIHLAWWTRPVAGLARQVRYVTMHPDGSFGAPEIIVSNGDLSQPQNLTRSFHHVDVALNGGNTFFAYEAVDNITGQRWIEIAKRLAPEEYTYNQLFAIDSNLTTAELGLHHEGSVMWMEWRTDDDHFAYSVFYGGSWSDPTEIALAGSSWVDVEQIRIEIRREVVSSEIFNVRGASGG